MHLLGGHKPELGRVAGGVELGELAVHKGVEAAHVGTHTVGGKIPDGHKELVLPAVFLPLAVAMGFTGEKMVAILVMLGSPTTVSCYIMAKNMGHEGTLTSSVVVATTFLSSVTLTAWLFLLRSMGLI